MARGRGQGPQRHVKGFRPGKEPPELRKRAAREQFGELSPTQERLVDLFAERTPEESRKLIRRWRITLLTIGVVLAAAAIALSFWSVWAGILVAVLAGVIFFFWMRLNRQREAMEAMADAVSGRGSPGKKRR